MIDNAWLQKLAPGDDVAVYWGTYRLEIIKVDRVTATQLVLANGMKFRRDDGRRVGKDYIASSWLAQPTAAIREKAFRQSAIAQISRVKWEQMPTATLRDAIELIETQEQAKV